jgi:diguanylate cyclase (GGDEF)-like protein/PAS domain S-box-containing protein
MSTILIVDDRSSNRKVLATLLDFEGHRLLEADSGAAAMDMVRAEKPDLVITDILMQSMDGFEFVQLLRADPALLHTPVIFQTATYSTSDARKLADSCGVRTVLPKPCARRRVLQAVALELGPRPMPQVPAGVASRRVAKPGKRQAIGDARARKSTDRRSARNAQRLEERLSMLLAFDFKFMRERDPARLVKLFFGAACDLIPSKITALCILDEEGKVPVHLVTRHVDPAMYGSHAAAHAGILGALLNGARARRMPGADVAPGALGLPAGHPAVRSFLGVPLATRDQVYGWLYFADRRDGEEFGAEDERVAEILGNKFALQYENTQLYDVIRHHAAKLQIETTARSQAQGIMREREAGLRHAQVMANLAHVVVSPDGAFESWSETLPALIGVDAGRMPKSTRELLPHIHPEDVQGVRSSSVAAGNSGTRTTFEYRLRRANGEIRSIRQVTEPIEGSGDPAGRLRWFNTLQDVTEQKRASDELERFRLAMDESLDSIFLTDPVSLRFVYANNMACKRLGYPRETLLTMGPQDIPPASREQIRREFDEVIVAGALGQTIERVFTHSSGSQGLTELHRRALHTDAGTLIVTIGRDVTERRESEIRLKRLNRVHAVLSGINALIVRAKTREELFREACRIAADSGQFRLAWIGIVDRKLKQVTPVAWSGNGRDYADYIRAMPVGLDEAGILERGFAGQAVMECKAQVSDDMTQDPRITLKREAEALGFHALGVLPLMVSGEAFGVLALYAGERNFFDAEEMKLLLGLAGDIAFAVEHIDAIARVEYLAFHDLLTGLPNRTVLVDRVSQMMSAAHRDGQAACVGFFDVERFRQVNETLGRPAGDGFLMAVAERFRVAVRAQDTVARVGGDVFAVAMGGLTRVAETMRQLVERLTAAFATPIDVDGHALQVTLTGGVSVYPNDGDTAELLCRNADAALQRAKSSSERLVFYTPEMNARAAELMAMENKLRRALEARQFVLHYQPKVDVRTRRLCGLEALIRWNDPLLGLVPPAQFIPLMEETGLILQVGSWALGQAVADIQAWRAKGLDAPRVAVNVSQIQLRQKNFVQTVLAAREGFGDAEAVLDLEITESMVMQNMEPTIRALQTLRGVGVETSLDDFGTGYSSLAYVARLPVAALKIDRSFVIEMTSSKYARTIVETVISLAHSLGLKVIAEGVDAEDQAALLVALGCDQMQGYLISKPVPADQIEALLAKV